MPKKRTLNDTEVGALQSRRKRLELPDPELAGLYIRVQPSGNKSFYVRARDINRKQHVARIGDWPALSIEKAREAAREAILAIKRGGTVTRPESFADVAEQWLTRYVDANKFASAKKTRQRFETKILPVFGGREFTSVRRDAVTKLLDDIEDTAGQVAADKVLDNLSGLFGWYAKRYENYTTPIVPGMRRSNSAERARKRILNDDEIRSMWATAESNGAFGCYLRLLLLTGQRRDKVASMKWADIKDGSWAIEQGEKEKGNAGVLILPQVALDVLEEQRARHIEGNPFVFPVGTDKHFCAFSHAKQLFDAKCPLPHWTLHDLRRTARSLMSRARVWDRHAEAALGHVVGGVEGVYDRHDYAKEKGEALAALAGLIATILAPQTDNVVTLKTA